MQNLTTNMRDKIILVSMLAFGVLAFISTAIGNVPMDNIIMAIITGLFGVYKGLPSKPKEGNDGQEKEG